MLRTGAQPVVIVDSSNLQPFKFSAKCFVAVVSTGAMELECSSFAI